MIRHRITTYPTNLPVALDSVKSYLRVTGNADDAIITTMIQASEQRLSVYCGQSFQTTTYELELDRFHDERIHLPMPPLVAVSAINYYDDDNTQNTVSSASYRVDAVSSSVILNDGYEWPEVFRDYAGVKITYTAGHGTAEGSVPSAIKLAVMLDVADMYENRGGGCDISPKVKDTLQPYRNIDRLAMIDYEYWYTYGL